MIILGIESSCDETAAAVVENGTRIRSSVVASQVAVHGPYGGVVPELASRKHMEAIVPVVDQALHEAGIGLDQLDGVAATRGPGLVGSLLVGFCFAKALAFTRGLPWVGVNHLEGHLNSIFLKPDPPPFPFVALLASGGHTSIYHLAGPIQAELLGQTLDDAAGEAYDKVAKMLGLGYPGGVVIDKLAQSGDPDRIPFPRALMDKPDFNFSFSGIKTAVLRHIQKYPSGYQDQLADIAAGFQEAVADVLTHKVIQAALTKNSGHIALVGGVAANSRLRERVTAAAAPHGIRVHIPSVALCGDNAAMIAAAGFHYFHEGRLADLALDVFSRAET